MSIKEITIKFDSDTFYRVKAAFVSFEFILNEFPELKYSREMWVKTRDAICHKDLEEILPKIYDLPSDFYVQRIDVDINMFGLIVIIASKEFDPIPEFEQIPRLEAKNADSQEKESK